MNFKFVSREDLSWPCDGFEGCQVKAFMTISLTPCDSLGRFFHLRSKYFNSADRGLSSRKEIESCAVKVVASAVEIDRKPDSNDRKSAADDPNEDS